MTQLDCDQPAPGPKTHPGRTPGDLWDALHELLAQETADALRYVHGSSGAVHHDGRVLGCLTALRLAEPFADGQSHVVGETLSDYLRQEIVALRGRRANAKPGSANHRHLGGQVAGLYAALELCGGQP